MTLLIGFAGRKGHGKDTAASILVEEHGYHVVKFATGIKTIARAFFTTVGFRTKDELFELTEGSLKEIKISALEHGGVDAFDKFVHTDADLLTSILGIDLRDIDYPPFEGNTSREFQQFLGTEIGRNLAGEKVWTDAAIRDARQYERAVITDVRFPNEVDAVREEGGLVLRVRRDNVGDTGFSNHPSEALIDTLDVDAEIPNNGTIFELHQRVLDAAKESGLV